MFALFDLWYFGFDPVVRTVTIVAGAIVLILAVWAWDSWDRRK